MIPHPPNEASRLAALRSYQLLDSQADEDFDLLTELAAELCGTPFSFVSLVDEDRVWYKSCYGKTAVQTPRDQDYCAWAILEQRELVIPDLTADLRTADMPLTKGGPHFRMYGGVNLTTNDGMPVGVLCVIDTRARQLTDRQLTLLRRLARQVLSLMELRRTERELQASLATVERLANEDELTGLKNRRAWFGAAREHLQLANRLPSSVSVMMLDVDHFKRINDTYGHPAGDAVLRGLGRMLGSHLRATDFAGRIGGEEFAVFLPATDARGALQVAENLRQAIEREPFDTGTQMLKVTASIGIASIVVPKENCTLETLMLGADQALYQAKTAGRNRTHLADALQTAEPNTGP